MSGEKKIVLVQRVWLQSSADYQAVERVRCKLVSQDTKVGDVLNWAKTENCKYGTILARGDVTLTEQENMDDDLE